MKKLLLITIALISLFGCSKKSTPDPQVTLSVTGKWFYKSDTLRIYNNNVLKQTRVFNETYAPFFQFNADGSGISMNDESGANTTTHFTYTVANKIITFNYPKQIVSGQTEDALSQKATIKQSSSTRLVIYFDDTSTNNGVTEEDAEIVYMSK